MPYRDDQGHTSRLRCRHSTVPGEKIGVNSLKAGELAVNAADATLSLAGNGGTVGTVLAERSPNGNMIVGDASWPVIQASIQSTIASANTAAYEEKVCPTPTGWNGSCSATAGVTMDDGRRVVFWYDNNSKTTPTKPFVWDVEANTIDENFFDDSALLVWYSVFDPAMASNGAIVCPGWQAAYGPVRLLFPDGTCYVFPEDAPGKAASDWHNNGTFYMNGTRSRVALTPDAGNPWIAFYNAGSGKMDRVANNWNDSGTSPALRSGIVLPNGKTMLHRGRTSGQYYAVYWDQAIGEVVNTFSTTPIPYCDTAAVLPDGKVLAMPLANPHVDVITPVIWDPEDTSRNAIADAAVIDQTAYAANAAFYGCLLSPLGTVILSASSPAGNTNFLNYDPAVGIAGEFGTAANDTRMIQLTYAGADRSWVVGSHGVGYPARAWRAWDAGFDAEVLKSAFMGKPS